MGIMVCICFCRPISLTCCVLPQLRYADLQNRFNQVKREWQRADVERQAMRHALTAARKNAQVVSEQNRRLTSLLRTVRLEQQRLSKAKETVMQALAMDQSLDLSDNDTMPMMGQEPRTFPAA